MNAFEDESFLGIEKKKNRGMVYRGNDDDGGKEDASRWRKKLKQGRC